MDAPRSLKRKWPTSSDPSEDNASPPTKRAKAFHLKDKKGRTVSSKLPFDVLRYFRDYLVRHELRGTAAKLASTNSEFYELFLPVVNYKDIRIHRENAAQLFYGVKQALHSPGEWDLEPGECRSAPTWQLEYKGHMAPVPIATRKVRLLRQCRHLTIGDRTAVQELIHAHEFDPSSQRLRKDLFPNLEYLSLGADAAAFIAGCSNPLCEERLSQLLKIISPFHLCVYYDSSWPHVDTEPYFERQAAISRQYSARRLFAMIKAGNSPLLLPDMDWLMGQIDEGWSLRSLTCHDIDTQPIPGVRCLKYRIFFSARQRPPPELIEWDAGLGRMLCDQMANAIAHVGPLGPLDDSKFEFIGVDALGAYRTTTKIRGEVSDEMADSTSAPSLGPSDINGDSLGGVGSIPILQYWQEVTPGEIECEDMFERYVERVWRRLPAEHDRARLEGRVKFTRREEAEPCVCCGKI